MAARWVLFLSVILLGGCQRQREQSAPAPTPEGPAAAAIGPAHPAPPRTKLAQVEFGHPVATHKVSPLPVCEARGEPLEAASRAYEQGRYEDALACAAQATAVLPDEPQAYSEKGAALSALGRFDEARLAYARALALEPAHPDALLGAAHLYAVSLPSSREHDELGLLYAERGLQGAREQGDRRMVGQFGLVAAMALNDLGMARQALSLSEEVLRLERGNREALYERAVALFELCRFAEAKELFRALVDDPERGAHAVHHLGLLLEREGRFAEADAAFARARKLAPKDFAPPQLLSPEQFEAELRRAVAELPADMRRDLEGIPVTAEEIPRDDDLLGGEPPLSPTILGLFRGPPLGEPCGADSPPPCRSVALYRRNLARAVGSRAELEEQIRVTLLHEVGHLRGEDDYELAARGLE
jgi:Flp pilus assembly protein TadD/predicted Zn-dependent protease with MMP-like domain